MLVLKELSDIYRDDPVKFVEHYLGHVTWSKQREILQAVNNNKKTAVRAAHGMSKTYTAAECVVWYLCTRPDCKIITTAPTWNQVKSLLWYEINRIYQTSRFKLPGECLVVNIKCPDNRMAIGFSTDKPERAEGYHSENILYIFDEAKGIPQWMWDSAKGAMSGGNAKWLVISTTDGVQVGEYFYRCFNDPAFSEGWSLVDISAYDSPNITGERLKGRDKDGKSCLIDSDKAKIPISNQDYIEEALKDWGKESILFQTKVLGQIVDEAKDSICKLSDVMGIFTRAQDMTGLIEVGVDVARFGDDYTVFTKRKGFSVLSIQDYSKKNMIELAELLEVFVEYNKLDKIKIDDTGVGGGLTDIMKSRGYNIVAVNFAQSANRPEVYPNAISEMWYETAKNIDKISCPENKRLLSELVNRRSGGYDARGRRTIETKKEYKKRFSRSPDMADSFLLAFYNPISQNNSALIDNIGIYE